MIKTPFSGDVWQDYHPFTSWWADTFRNAMGQYGFININEMQSSDAGTGARYRHRPGQLRQADRPRRRGPSGHLREPRYQRLEARQRKALKSFLRMAEELAQYKGDHQPVTKQDIAALVDAIRDAEVSDSAVFVFYVHYSF